MGAQSDCDGLIKKEISEKYFKKYAFILLGFDSSDAQKKRIATYYLPGDFCLSNDETIKQWNECLNKPENYFPFEDATSAQEAIKSYVDGYPIEATILGKASNKLNDEIKKILEKLSNNDEENWLPGSEYPSELFDFEKKHLFTSSGEWIYYPVMAMNLCFAMLIAELKDDVDKEAMLKCLNELAYKLPDKLLYDLSKNNITHPLNDIAKTEDINIICSLIASQVSLNDTEFKSGVTEFKSGVTGLYQKEEKELKLKLKKPLSGHEIVFKYTGDKEKDINELLHRYQIRFDRYCLRLRAATRSAHAAIMSRNFSHNVGSHALANPKLYTSIGLADGEVEKKGIQQRLETFHTYMQGRLDFLARAISKVKDRPEPLFFLNDVMSGFFKQGVLLDTLIDDIGFPAEKIKFHVHINKRDTPYEWNSNKHLFEAKGEVEDDPIVGIPGGMIGTHALYAFLENILRNAVKYGANIKSCGDLLKIHLQLRRCPGKRSDREDVPAWVLSVWDNVSSDDKCENIRKFINQPLVKDNGEMNHEGHGIQEMKLCADLLSGGLGFTADDDYNKEKCNHCDKKEKCEPTKHYLDYVTKGDNSISINGNQSIRCYVKDNKRLTYDLLMPIPALLGVVQMGAGQSQEDLPDYIKYYDSIEELAEKGAHIGVLLDVGCEDKNKELEDIARFHRALPFRLMVVTDEAGDWKTELKKKTPFKDGDIPKNRVRIYGNDGLKEFILSGDCNKEFLKCSNWNAVTLKVYDAWLRAYKKDLPAGKQWKLCIGFDHGDEVVVSKWKKLEDSCVDIYVSAKKGKKEDEEGKGNADTQEVVGECLEKSEVDKLSLFFDNHGEACNGVDDKSPVGFYQKFGLNEGLSLYQSLVSPPQSHFGFGLFVYSLVESALTKVYILDERVAKSVVSTSEKTEVRKSLLRSYKAANLFPFFAFDKKDKDKVLISSIKDETTLELDNVKSCEDADVLLIHEGVMDMLVKEKVWDQDGDTFKLFGLAPFIVRTSGRGRETRHLHDTISFLEFNEVSGNTYQEMNKPRLVKALLGSSGNYAAIRAKDKDK